MDTDTVMESDISGSDISTNIEFCMDGCILLNNQNLNDFNEISHHSGKHIPVLLSNPTERNVMNESRMQW